MRTFQEFILNETPNTNAADVNELLLGYYLAGSWNKFDSPNAARKQLELKQGKITDTLFQEQDDRAKRMADATLMWAKKNGYSGVVSRVYWTARPGSLQKAVGSTGVVDPGNPTDILIKFSDGKFLGISAKSTLRNTEIGFKNPGMGTIEKVHKANFSQVKDAVENKFIEKWGLSRVANTRKKEIRADKAISDDANVERSKLLEMLRDLMLYALNAMSQEDAKKHILNDWMDAGKAVYPMYIKVTGKKSAVSIHNPLENSKIGALSKGPIKFSKVGGGAVGVTADGKRIMKMRFKYVSQAMASSMKLSGDPW